MGAMPLRFSPDFRLLCFCALLFCHSWRVRRSPLAGTTHVLGGDVAKATIDGASGRRAPATRTGTRGLARAMGPTPGISSSSSAGANGL